VSSSKPNPQRPPRTVSLVTLGCARNEVDSEELAGRLEAAGWSLSGSDEASVVLVNTCGFIEAAKQESVSELLDAAGSGAKVVAAGCLAERYGSELAAELPEWLMLARGVEDDVTDESGIINRDKSAETPQRGFYSHWASVVGGSAGA